MIDRRVLVFGDSFVAGVGDPTGLGWTGRVASGSHAAGLPLTTYALGVRGETSAQIAARWRAEAGPRVPHLAASWLDSGVSPPEPSPPPADVPDCRVVFCFGANDATEVDGALRVEPADSLANLERCLDEAAELNLRHLVIGPPPAGDEAQVRRILALGEVFADACARREVRYIPTAEALLAGETWMREAAAGDGAHPGAGGYAAMARIVLGGWLEWLAAPADDGGARCRSDTQC